MLRDRLVCGVRDIRIQRRLLAEPKLTLKRALDLSLAIEAEDKDASEIQKADGQGGTTQKAVILRMPSAIVVVKLAI